MSPAAADRGAVLQGCAQRAPTLLENLLWGWLLGHLSPDVYFEELVITDLRGPGHLPDDFQGVP